MPIIGNNSDAPLPGSPEPPELSEEPEIGEETSVNPEEVQEIENEKTEQLSEAEKKEQESGISIGTKGNINWIRLYSEKSEDRESIRIQIDGYERDELIRKIKGPPRPLQRDGKGNAKSGDKKDGKHACHHVNHSDMMKVISDDRSISNWSMVDLAKFVDSQTRIQSSTDNRKHTVLETEIRKNWKDDNIALWCQKSNFKLPPEAYQGIH